MKSALALLLLIPQFCHATLGQGTDSIAKVEAMAMTSRKTSSGTGYTIQTISSASYTVKEFQRPDGVIFAVAWQGAARPDLQVILGDYFQEFTLAHEEKMKVAHTRPVRVESANVVVSFGGHMRNLTGLAYVPKLVPTGVNVESLR